jgi:hypothetical protein
MVRCDQSEPVAMGDSQMERIGTPQPGGMRLLKPAPGEKKVFPARLQHPEPLPAEQLQGGADDLRPLAGQPGFRRAITAVAMEQRHQQAGVDVEACGRRVHDI